jgi:hypothetical protein
MLACGLMGTTWTAFNQDNDDRDATFLRGRTTDRGPTIDRSIDVTKTAEGYNITARSAPNRAVPFDRHAQTVFKVRLPLHVDKDAIKWSDTSPGLGGTAAAVPNSTMFVPADEELLTNILACLISLVDAAPACSACIVETKNAPCIAQYPGHCTSGINNGRGGKHYIVPLFPNRVTLTYCAVFHNAAYSHAQSEHTIVAAVETVGVIGNESNVIRHRNCSVLAIGAKLNMADRCESCQQYKSNTLDRSMRRKREKEASGVEMSVDDFGEIVYTPVHKNTPKPFKRTVRSCITLMQMAISVTYCVFRKPSSSS